MVYRTYISARCQQNVSRHAQNNACSGIIIEKPEEIKVHQL